MVKMSAGKSIVEALKAEKTRYIFGVVGSAYLDILDAIYGRDDIKFVGCRHEQGAGFMALGFARATGLPSVCMAQNGPGVTNLVTTTAAALVGQTPMVVLGGAPMVGQTYRDSIQELDQMSIFRPVSKAVMQINRPERGPEMIRDAFRVAMAGKMGPVYVDMPRDIVSGQDVEIEMSLPESYRPDQKLHGDPESIDKAVALLEKSKFPVVLAGGGIVWSQADKETLRIAEILEAPVITSYERNDAVDNSHPHYIGALGRAGSPEAIEAVKNADVLLALGTRLSHFTTFYDHRFISKSTQIIQVEIDQREIGRNYPVTVGILGDARSVASQIQEKLASRVSISKNNIRIDRVRQLRAKRIQRLQTEENFNSMPIKPQRVYAELRKVLPNGTAVTFDAGGSPSFGYDRIDFSGPRTLFSTLDLACLGGALPQALGVKMALPNQPVVSISGDGGFFFNIQELETAVRWKIPVVNIVMNNNSWGSEKAYQNILYDKRYVESDITNPRYDRLAELCGAHGFYAEKPDEIRKVVQEALAIDGPSVIEIPIDPEELQAPARASDAFQSRAN